MKDLQEDDTIGPVRERLGRYEETPSAKVWNRIVAAQNTERKSVWPVWIEGAAIIGMAAILFFGIDRKEIVVVEKEKIVFVEKGNEIAKAKGIEDISVVKKQEPEQAKQERPHQYKVEQKEIAPDQPITSTTESSVESVTSSSVPSSIVIDNPQRDSSSLVAEGVTPPYKKPKSKFQFYFSLTPSLSFQKIIPSHDDVIVQGFANTPPLSMKRFGFGLDAGIQRDINRFFGYYGGLSFYRQQQELTYYYYDRAADVTRVGDEWTFVISRDQHTRTFDYTMTNIGASAGMLVTLKGEKLMNKFGAGLMYTYGLNSRSQYVAYQVLYRAELKANDHLTWFAQPTFIYSFISKEHLNEPFTLKPYRAGISLGVLYRF
jgi:hypothetical protein